MNTSNPYLVIFDCDGTLIDSGHNIVTAMCEAWRSCDLEPPHAISIRRIVGLKLEEAIQKLMPRDCEVEVNRLVQAYIDSFSRFRDEPEYTEPLYPGIRDCLNDLVSLGFSLGIATGKSRRGLLRTLERHNLSELFCVLNTADDGPCNPYPDFLLVAIYEDQTIAE